MDKPMNINGHHNITQQPTLVFCNCASSHVHFLKFYFSYGIVWTSEPRNRTALLCNLDQDSKQIKINSNGYWHIVIFPLLFIGKLLLAAWIISLLYYLTTFWFDLSKGTLLASLLNSLNWYRKINTFPQLSECVFHAQLDCLNEPSMTQSQVILKYTCKPI